MVLGGEKFIILKVPIIEVGIGIVMKEYGLVIKSSNEQPIAVGGL